MGSLNVGRVSRAKRELSVSVYSGGCATIRCVTLALLLLSLVHVLGCKSKGRTRPVGFMRLGSVLELAQSEETFLSQERILLRYDSRGFSAMSTSCTYDLSPLTRVSEQGGRRWRSSYSGSGYDDKGHVIEGPSKVNLPFYELKIDQGRYGGPADTLYVEIGSEKPEDWRLPFAIP